MAAGEEPDAAFPAIPGKQCSWCDFRPSCPTGQAAVPARETWSFLAEDDPA
jgi:putative RecB family exonuclease